MSTPASPCSPTRAPGMPLIATARASYNAAAAKLALQRTLAHFDEYLVAAR